MPLFTTESLTDGRAEFTLGDSRRPALVPLEHSHLEPFRLIDFSHLRWQGDVRDQRLRRLRKTQVLCGIDRTGRRVVIADPGHSRLECDWWLAGRSSLGATEFAMCLPPAVSPQLVLRVPAELSVECDQGVLVRGAKDADGQSALWQLELGSRSSCRLRIITPAASAQQHVFYDQDTTLVVATDRLRLQSKLQLEVFGASLRTLHLSISAGLRVETISYGDDFPLPVPANAADKAREISLDLPEPLLGKGRTLTVEASATTRANQLLNLPQVDVIGAVRREGQVAADDPRSPQVGAVWGRRRSRSNRGAHLSDRRRRDVLPASKRGPSSSGDRARRAGAGAGGTDTGATRPAPRSVRVRCGGRLLGQQRIDFFARFRAAGRLGRHSSRGRRRRLADDRRNDPPGWRASQAGEDRFFSSDHRARIQAFPHRGIASVSAVGRSDRGAGHRVSHIRVAGGRNARRAWIIDRAGPELPRTRSPPSTPGPFSLSWPTRRCEPIGRRPTRRC